MMQSQGFQGPVELPGGLEPETKGAGNLGPQTPSHNRRCFGNFRLISLSTGDDEK